MTRTEMTFACATGTIVGLLLMSMLPGLVQAQLQPDSDGPIEITADQMEWLHEKQIAIARGNADAIQGTYHLHADVLTAHIDKAADPGSNEIERIEADGGVVLTTVDKMAKGDTGVYDVKNGVAVLEGAVILTQGDNVMRGNRLVMNLETGLSTLDNGDGAGQASADGLPAGRVRAIFSPSGADETPSPATESER